MDDSMNKRPSFQFYPADWRKDPQLQMCSMSTQGIWINLLCLMWESKIEGEISGTRDDLRRCLGCTIDDFNQFLIDIKRHKFGNVTICNRKLTFINRRMKDVFLEREGTKERVRKHRRKHSNTDVTPYSSTSSSTSSLNNIYSPNSEEFRLAKLLLDLILERKSDYKKPNLQQWSVHTDRILRLDGRKFAQVEAVVRWCQSDDFWQNNILSTEKLRKHFDRLELQKDERQTVNTGTGKRAEKRSAGRDGGAAGQSGQGSSPKFIR